MIKKYKYLGYGFGVTLALIVLLGICSSFVNPEHIWPDIVVGYFIAFLVVTGYYFRLFRPTITPEELQLERFAETAQIQWEHISRIRLYSFNRYEMETFRKTRFSFGFFRVVIEGNGAKYGFWDGMDEFDDFCQQVYLKVLKAHGGDKAMVRQIMDTEFILWYRD